MDGAAISANMGVNPSLSITAQAERAASLWPNKGEVDSGPRRASRTGGSTPIAPEHPVVPESAPGALRWLPIESIGAVARQEAPAATSERAMRGRRISPGGDMQSAAMWGAA